MGRPTAGREGPAECAAAQTGAYHDLRHGIGGARRHEPPQILGAAVGPDVHHTADAHHGLRARRRGESDRADGRRDCGGRARCGGPVWHGTGCNAPRAASAGGWGCRPTHGSRWVGIRLGPRLPRPRVGGRPGCLVTACRSRPATVAASGARRRAAAWVVRLRSPVAAGVPGGAGSLPAAYHRVGPRTPPRAARRCGRPERHGVGRGAGLWVATPPAGPRRRRPGWWAMPLSGEHPPPPLPLAFVPACLRRCAHYPWRRSTVATVPSMGPRYHHRHRPAPTHADIAAAGPPTRCALGGGPRGASPPGPCARGGHPHPADTPRPGRPARTRGWWPVPRPARAGGRPSRPSLPRRGTPARRSNRRCTLAGVARVPAFGRRPDSPGPAATRWAPGPRRAVGVGGRATLLDASGTWSGGRGRAGRRPPLGEHGVLCRPPAVPPGIVPSVRCPLGAGVGRMADGPAGGWPFAIPRCCHVAGLVPCPPRVTRPGWV